MKTFQPVLMPLAVFLAALCLLGAISAGLGVRFEWWGVRTGFGVLKWSVYLVAVPVVLVVISAIQAKVMGARLFDYRHGLVLLVALLVFGLPFQISREFKKLPTLADATTNFADAPEFVDLAPIREQTSKNPLAYRGGEAVALQQQYFPELVSLQVSQSPAQVISTATAIANELGLEVVASKPEQGRLEATATTFWFGFKDDVVVRARAQEDGRTQVDIRSASRVGYLDGGVNAKRVEKFLQGLSGG